MATHSPNLATVAWVDATVPQDVMIEAYIPQTVGGVWVPVWWHGLSWWGNYVLPPGVNKAKPTMWRAAASPWTIYDVGP